MLLTVALCPVPPGFAMSSHVCVPERTTFPTSTLDALKIAQAEFASSFKECLMLHMQMAVHSLYAQN